LKQVFVPSASDLNRFSPINKLVQFEFSIFALQKLLRPFKKMKQREEVKINFRTQEKVKEERNIVVAEPCLWFVLCVAATFFIRVKKMII
jgi:hypothetical protein